MLADTFLEVTEPNRPDRSWGRGGGGGGGGGVVFLKFLLLCFLLYTPGCLGTCVFGVTNCVIPKRASDQLIHGQIKLDLRRQ